MLIILADTMPPCQMFILLIIGYSYPGLKVARKNQKANLRPTGTSFPKEAKTAARQSPLLERGWRCSRRGFVLQPILNRDGYIYSDFLLLIFTDPSVYSVH